MKRKLKAMPFVRGLAVGGWGVSVRVKEAQSIRESVTHCGLTGLEVTE